MNITAVTIDVPDLDATARFFHDVLGAGIHEHGDSVELAIGTSRLALRQGDPDPAGYYHLAFDIPENAITEARDLLRQRADILPAGEDGIVTASPEWDAHSMYFNGPGNLNLELIARHRLDNAISRPFAFSDILRISEVGIPVPSTADAARSLATTFGLEPFTPPTESFAPVGSDEGLLILVNEGRTWFPTDNQPTTDRPLQIRLGNISGHVTLGHHCVVTGS